jgi:F0F1-type ATP synthase assembly protein I
MVDDARASGAPDQGTSLATRLNEDDAWGMVSTLVAGPVTWGLIGGGLDMLVGTHRVFLAIGVVVGFVTSFLIVYVRHGRQ